MRHKRLSDMQEIVLANAASFRPLDTDCGRSIPAFRRSLNSLRDHGLIQDCEITEAGRAALAAGKYPLTEKATDALDHSERR